VLERKASFFWVKEFGFFKIYKILQAFSSVKLSKRALGVNFSMYDWKTKQKWEKKKNTRG